VRISNKPVISLGDGCDILVAFDQEAYELHGDSLNPGGVLIYDADLVKPRREDNLILYGVPFQRLAREELDFVRGTNTIIQGLLAGLFGLPVSALEEIAIQRYQRRRELMEKNLEALRFGYEYVKKLTKRDGFWLGAADNVPRLVMSGNQAIVAGALHAGCRYFAGYPITPASDILEAMAVELPKLGGVCLQAEDEMAALASCLGASYAGVKAMTATSGPGLSLMTELLGLASMAEIPVVVVDAQRAGPSTGMPTKLEQADLFHALYGGHGDFPRIVVAPGSVADCLRMTVEAFNLAEKYQCPVILLSDQSLSHRTETLEMPDVSTLKVVERVRPRGEDTAGFKRYEITERGVSPMPVPGWDRFTYVAPGLEHDELGHPVLTPEVHEAMMAKRFHKMEVCAQEIDHQEFATRFGDERAPLGIISWGATEGSVREAVDRARTQGYKVAALHLRVLNPLPVKTISDFLADVSRVMIPEVNYQGQLARHLAAEFGIRPIKVHKIGGLPFTPGEILARIKEVLEDA